MTPKQAAAVARVREAATQANLCMPPLSTVIVATDDAAAILAALDAAQYSLKNAHLMIEVDGTTIEAQASRIAVLEAAQAAAQAPREVPRRLTGPEVVAEFKRLQAHDAEAMVFDLSDFATGARWAEARVRELCGVAP